MRNQIVSYGIVILLAFSNNTKAQTSGTASVNWLTPGGIYDHVFDNYGNEYELANLSITASRPIGGNNSVNSAPSTTCSAGYFNLYFAANSVFDGTTAAAVDKRNIVCQVFSDLTGFISSPLSPLPNTGVKINIFCSNTSNTTTAGPAGQGSPIYCFPAFPTNTNQGIADNQIFKAISTGSDPYANLPIGVFYNGNNFYHGYISANPSYTYNLVTGTNNINSNESDFYSIMLHEATHALGFISLLSSTGLSQFGQYHNYFSRYDQFLFDSGSTPLIATTTASCSTSNLYCQANPTAIATGTCPGDPTVTNCTLAVKYQSSNVNVKVYTPSCFLGGSSLSHFEDICSTPTNYVAPPSCTSGITPPNNNLYYLMSDQNGFGDCYIKRYLKEEERFVLCDIGYSVNTTYTSTAWVAGTSTVHNYGGAACPGTNIWGVNDGLLNGVYTLTTSTGSLAIPISTSITANDAPSTASISCLEVVYSNATCTLGATHLSVSATAGSGLVLIKYLPKNSGGVFGNATYIFVYFIPASCNPPSVCNMVQNSGFENLAAGLACGEFLGPNGVPPLGMSQLSCWDNYQPNPDLYTRSCTTGTLFELGANTRGTIPAIDSYNSSPNDRIVGIVYQPGVANEVLKNNLSSPLIPGNSYQISFLVKNYTGQFYATTTSSVVMNPNVAPIVLSFASYSTFAFAGGGFPSGLSPLISFTIPANTSTSNLWTAVNSTFVCPSTPTSQQYALLIGMDPTNTSALTGGANVYCFLDEISINPIPLETFSIPTSTACGYASYTNLAQYASTTGTFSGAGVTYTAGMYHFNTPQTLVPGTYPVAFTYSANGCLSTLWQNMVVSPSFSIIATVTGTTCLNAPSSITLNATAGSQGPTTCSWQPGGLIGNNVNATPTILTTYTVYATDVNNCTVSNTLSIPFATNCCASSFSTETSTSFTSTLTTISGPIAIVNSPTIQAGATLDLTGEITFPPNTSITVESGGILRIKESHLYSCAAGLWQGIIVKNGGKITTAKEPPATIDNLIEDAAIAIDITGHTSSTISLIAELSNTTFNKNHISINISNYQSTISTYPFFIENCVFTSRNLPYNSTQWPQVGETSTLNTVGADLRTAINPTTDLSPPYLAQSGFTITNLKSPYASESSSIAIKLSNVGATSSGNYYGIQIGSGTSVNSFNLFDAHRVGIYSTNSNVYSFNNVFQNSTSTGNGYIKPIVPGSGIYSEVIGGTGYDALFNSLLDLNPNGNTNKSLGNRFWDCYFAVSTVNNFSLNAKYATVRSTHTITPNWFIQGSYGFSAISNRFGGYAIVNCDFNNILHPAGLVFKPGAFDIGAGTQNGIYVKKIDIYNNFMSPALSSVASQGTNWMVAGIKLNAPISGPAWQTTTSTGISIYNNEIDRSLQGILLVGTKHNITKIYNNTISLVDNDQLNPGYSTWQPAIFIASSQSVSAYSNTLSSITSTNIYVSLVHTGFSSSSNIYCNKTTGGWRGFLFEGPNNFTRWKGNLMQSQRWGLTLFAGGIIGPQGSSNSPSDNQWLGSWTGGNYNTYVDIGSNAINSPLTTRTGTWEPGVNSGTVGISQWYGFPGNGSLFTTTLGAYSCGTSTNPPQLSIPIPEDYESDEMKYIADKALYNFLYENEDLRPGGGDFANFFDSLANSSIADFYAIELLIYEGNITGAANINNDVSPTNTVEENYKEFYRLYIAHTNNNFTADDSTSLYNLAHLCPGTNGACVYKARALYSLIYLSFEDYSQACEWTESRLANFNQMSETRDREFDIIIFPNPSTGLFTVRVNDKSETLTITIQDVCGRTIFSQSLTIKDSVGNLDINLSNGMYFMTIKNNLNETFTRKVFISK